MALDILSYSKIQQIAKKIGSIGKKKVDLKNLADGDIVRYDEVQDIFIADRDRAIVKQWEQNTEYFKGEICVFDDILHWVIVDNYKSHDTNIEFDIVDGKIIPFVMEAGTPNVLVLDYEITDSASNLRLTWTNPSEASYETREVYFSDMVDIASMRYDEIQNYVTSGEVELISSGAGAGSGAAETLDKAINTRKTYYVKVFAQHFIDGEYKNSSGRFLTIDNPDLIAPVATSDLQVTVDEGTATLTWTQPTDADFFHAKIVRSKTSIPSTPNDGMVLDTVSGSGNYTDIGLEKETIYYYRVFFYDDAGEDGMQHGVEGNYSASNGVEIIDKLIYGFDLKTETRIKGAIGLVPTDFDNIYPWSNIARAVVDNTGAIIYYLDDNDSSLKDDGIQAANLDGTDGNVVVEYPSFYYSYKNGEIIIGEEEFVDSLLFPRTLVGAFEATETATGELQSVASVKPLTGKSVSEYRVMSSNIGAGWQQKDIGFLDVLKFLFIVEYGGLQSQDLIGDGIVSGLDSELTGGTVSLGNKSGTVANGAISYRGLENPWGNVWEFCEGVIATDLSYYVTESGFDSFVSDTNTGSYSSIGKIPITDNGFISELTNSKIVIANAVLGDSASFAGDYHFSHKTGEINMIAHGGNYVSGVKAGLFNTHVGLKPFGKEQEMTLLNDGVGYKIYEELITENDLEKLKGLAVE